jgi:hypothetical protein
MVVWLKGNIKDNKKTLFQGRIGRGFGIKMYIRAIGFLSISLFVSLHWFLMCRNKARDSTDLHYK